MTPNRIAVKFFLTADTAQDVDLDAFIGLFHRVIQEKSFDGLLLDVADYAHVPNGPGVILIGHDVDYGMDFTGEGPGLQVLRKRYEGLGLAEVLRDTLSKALRAAAVTVADDSIGVRIDPGSFQLLIFDRLADPNDEAHYEELQKEVAPVAEKLYGAGYQVERLHSSDPRRALSLRVRGQGETSLEDLAERLGS